MDKPILRIPMLAIHLNRDIYEKGFKPNKQNELAPILATAVKAAADKTSESGKLVPQEANTDTVVSEPTGVTPADAKLKHVRAQVTSWSPYLPCVMAVAKMQLRPPSLPLCLLSLAQIFQ